MDYTFWEHYEEDKQASKDFGYGNEIRLDDDDDNNIEAYVDEMLCYESIIQFDKEQNEINQVELNYVKDHINYTIDNIDFDEFSSWQHVGYVEVVETSNANTGYPSYKFYLEKDNPKSLKYMRQDDDDEFHSMVWQTVGYCEDDYSGFLLFPLNDGRYWKISYSC
jgi:hypothetical protein